MKIDRSRFLAMVAAISAGGGMTATASASQPTEPAPERSDAPASEDTRVAQSCIQPWSATPAACTGLNAAGWELEYCMSMSESMAMGSAASMVTCFNNGGNIYDCIEDALANTCPTNEATQLCSFIQETCGANMPDQCVEMMSGLYYQPQKQVTIEIFDAECAFPMWSSVESIFL